MNLDDLITALLARDALAARQWMADATRSAFDWSRVLKPEGLDPFGGAVAAGVVEMMAERTHVHPPNWTALVPAAPSILFLVSASESMPRLRRSCQEEGPWPLRKRSIFAPPEFLTMA